MGTGILRGVGESGGGSAADGSADQVLIRSILSVERGRAAGTVTGTANRGGLQRAAETPPLVQGLPGRWKF